MTAFSVEGFVNPFLLPQKLQQWKRQHKPKVWIQWKKLQCSSVFIPRGKKWYRNYTHYPYLLVTNTLPTANPARKHRTTTQFDANGQRELTECILNCWCRWIAAMQAKYTRNKYHQQWNEWIHIRFYIRFWMNRTFCYFLRVDAFYSCDQQQIVLCPQVMDTQESDLFSKYIC